MTWVERLHVCVLAAFVCLAAAGPAVALRVVVISDLNGSYGSTRYDTRVSAAIKAIVALDPDLVISTGDMVAGQRRPHLAEDEIRAMWRAFHAAVSDPLVAAGIPLAVTPGNHDASGYDGFERERHIFAEEWRVRRPDLKFVGTGRYPFSYAFDLGGVRFVSLDVTTVGPLAPEQQSTLRDAMVAAPDTRIVFSHLPLWPFATGRETEIIGDADAERLFADLGVDLHLSGHHHAFYPGTVGGLAVVSQACLGAGPRKWVSHPNRSAHAITVLDIDQDGGVHVSALLGPAFDRPMDIETLPPALHTRDRIIKRLDLSKAQDVEWSIKK